jgi:hypothetical protein
MGLGNNEGGNSKFVTIVGGMWTLRVPEGTEGSIPRELTKGDKAGTLVHELRFEYVNGMLKAGELKSGPYGVDLCLDIEDEGVVYKVQMGVDSDFFRSFAKCSADIDPSKDLYIGLGQPSDGGFPYLYVKSGGVQLTANHTQKEPNGCPPWVKKTVAGQTKWDKDEQNEFCYNLVADFLAKEAPAQERSDPPASADPEDDTGDSSLPF